MNCLRERSETISWQVKKIAALPVIARNDRKISIKHCHCERSEAIS
jgi:hypothetical protein